MLRLGLFLGLAIATKWNAAYASLFIGLDRAGSRRTRLSRTRGATWRDEGVQAHLFWVPAGLVVLPALVYSGGVRAVLLTGHDVGQFIELQHQIFYYHTHLHATHAYQSRWWSGR